MLAEVGKVSDSLKYCQAILKSLKGGRAPEVETWKQLVLSLDERIIIHLQGGYSTLCESAETNLPATQGKASGSGGASRFHFGFGSQLLQKTVGLVLRPCPGQQAKLGEKNKFYYDEKLKRWVEEGSEPSAEEAELPPPPTTAYFNSFRAIFWGPTYSSHFKSIINLWKDGCSVKICRDFQPSCWTASWNGGSFNDSFSPPKTTDLQSLEKALLGFSPASSLHGEASHVQTQMNGSSSINDDLHEVEL